MLYRRIKYCQICGDIAKLGVKVRSKNYVGLYIMNMEFAICKMSCLEDMNKRNIISGDILYEAYEPPFCPFQKEKESIEQHKKDTKEFLECEWVKDKYGYATTVAKIKDGEYLVEKVGEHFRIIDNQNRLIFTFYKPINPSPVPEAWAWWSDSENYITTSTSTTSISSTTPYPRKIVYNTNAYYKPLKFYAYENPCAEVSIEASSEGTNEETEEV